MHPIFRKFTQANGQLVWVNLHNINSVTGGKDQSTIHLIGGQNVTIGHDVEMLVQTFENDLGVGERAVHKAA
jgi:uncharacterized protein YlzI (FlbEa/FlbD family)